MCGICGYFGANVAHRPLPMLQLKHRGPDDEGIVTGSNYKFGHTRLAIVDVANGHQPMLNEDNTLCIVFNGEIYNHRSLRAHLKQAHDFRTECDTEVILHLFEEEGVDGLQKLDGMFALAIATPDRIILARDPVGIKPLYFQEDGDNLFFASELKAFYHSRTPVVELKPGTIYCSMTRYYPYYELPWEFERPMSWEECLAGLRREIKAAVNKRLMSDVPLGSFLSGGLDSSIITALVKSEREQLHTFSVATEQSSDREYARLAARRLGTQHHEYLISPAEVKKALPTIIYHLESFDRSLVRSAVANYFLAKIAASEVKVVLTGEGADELFAGYHYLDQYHDPDALNQELWRITRDLYNTNLQRTDRMTMAHGLEARVPFLDIAVIRLAMQIPAAFKRDLAKGDAKLCLREAFRGEALLPPEIINRRKEKFSDGSGMSAVLETITVESIPEGGFYKELERGTSLHSREEYYYFQIYCSFFGREAALNLVGRSRS